MELLHSHSGSPNSNWELRRRLDVDLKYKEFSDSCSEYELGYPSSSSDEETQSHLDLNFNAPTPTPTPTFIPDYTSLSPMEVQFRQDTGMSNIEAAFAPYAGGGTHQLHQQQMMFAGMPSDIFAAVGSGSDGSALSSGVSMLDLTNDYTPLPSFDNTAGYLPEMPMPMPSGSSNGFTNVNDSDWSMESLQYITFDHNSSTYDNNNGSSSSSTAAAEQDILNDWLIPSVI
jgi:hypothetical protein